MCCASNSGCARPRTGAAPRASAAAARCWWTASPGWPASLRSGGWPAGPSPPSKGWTPGCATAGPEPSRPPAAASAVSARRESSAASRACTPRAPTTATAPSRHGPWPPISAAAPAGSPSSTPGSRTPAWPARPVRPDPRARPGGPMPIVGPPSREERRSRPDPMWPSETVGSPTTPRRTVPWWLSGPLTTARPPTSTAGWWPRPRSRPGGRRAGCPAVEPPRAGTRRWRCRRGTGRSRCAPAGPSPATWRPTPPGASPAAGPPPRWATAARSAASATRR